MTITSYSVEDYRLRSPDPELFLEVLEMTLRYIRSVGGASPYEYDADLIQEEIQPLSLFLAADLDNYYPGGLPNATRIIEDPSYASDLHIGYPEPPLQRVLRTVIIEHIHQHGFLSTDNVDFVPIPISLDDALQPTWLVEISIPRYGLHEWLPFYLNEAGEYQIIDNELAPVISFWNTQADVTHDLTGDGIPEVLLIQDDYLLAGRYGGYISVNTWDGDRLRHLERIDYSAHVSRGSVEQEIGDFDGDGREEIRIIQHHYANFDCSWDEISIYQWQGLEPRHSTTGSEKPDSPLCDTAEALSFRSSLTSAERIQLLEDVLQELSLEKAPSADYLALIRVRLAMLYAAQGQDNEARQVLAGIDALPSGSGFIQFVNSHSETTGDSIVALCDNMFGAIEGPPGPMLGTDIDNYIDITSVFGAYPLDGSPSPDAVCPLPWLVSKRVNIGQFPLEEDLTLSFASLDLPYLPIKEVNLDSDPELEQIGLIDLSEKTFLILDAVENEWIPSVIDTFTPPVIELQSDYRDIDNDGQTELFMLVRLDNECGGVNETGKQTRRLYVIEQIEGRFESIQNRSICESEVDFSSLDAGETFVSPPFWAELAGEFPWTGVYFGENDNFYEYLDLLTAEVIHQEKPVDDTLNSIDTLMHALPPNDPLSDIIRPRLLFTRGYHLELNGNDANAVETYLELIQLAPRSPWSWLAWLRLETAENVN